MELARPLFAPTVCLEVEESSCTSHRKLYVSSAVLDCMRYFKVGLSDRWRTSLDAHGESTKSSIGTDSSSDLSTESGDVLRSYRFQLPEGCSVSSLTLLLERLHFPQGCWSKVDLETALQMSQLAAMLLVEGATGDSILDELVALLRAGIHTNKDIDRLRAICDGIEAPPALSKLAAQLGKPMMISTSLSDDQLYTLLYNVLESGQSHAAAAASGIVRQRAQTSSEAAAGVAATLQKMFLKGRAGQPSKTFEAWDGTLTAVHKINSDFLVEKQVKGLGNIFEVATEFILARPEHFGSLSRAMFCKRKTLSTVRQDQSMKQTFQRCLIAILDGCFSESGKGKLSPEDVASFIETLIQHKYEEEFLAASASLEKAMLRAPRPFQECVCEALCRLNCRTLAKLVTSNLIASLAEPERRRLCVAIVPEMHRAPTALQATIVEMISQDDHVDQGKNVELPAKRQKVT